MQRFRYVVPMVNNTPSPTFVSEYNEIDVALGFMNLNGIAQYLGKNLNYDYILIDTDNLQTLNSFMIPALKKVFFVTSYDEYDLQRGIEILRYIQSPVLMSKIVLPADITPEQDAKLDHLTENLNVKWKEEKVQFADETVNRRVTLENQISKIIKLKNYTSTYRDSLEYVVSLLTDASINSSNLKRALKKI
jgi:regulator of RNase E activity RraB